MKLVFAHIVERSRRFTERPLFLYLRDTSVDPQRRLKFVPWISHFVMTFADLYHFFLPENPPRDRYEELVNIHLSEEGTHWKWFLADLTNLGLDPTLRFTDALRFIWNDATLKTRGLAYEMCKLSAGLTSLQKLVMVLAIEATGRVGLEAAVPTGVETARAGRRLVYFGNHHLDTERKHTVEGEEVHGTLTDLTLTDETRKELCSIVDQVFDRFGDFVDEAFVLARNGTGFGEVAEKPSVLEAGVRAG